MFKLATKTVGRLATAGSAVSAACSVLAVRRQRKPCRRVVDVSVLLINLPDTLTVYFRPHMAQTKNKLPSIEDRSHTDLLAKGKTVRKRANSG